MTLLGFVVQNKQSFDHYLASPAVGRRWGTRSLAIVFSTEKEALAAAEQYSGRIQEMHARLGQDEHEGKNEDSNRTF